LLNEIIKPEGVTDETRGVGTL